MKDDSVVTLTTGDDILNYVCETDHRSNTGNLAIIASVGVVKNERGDLHKLCMKCFCEYVAHATGAKIVIYDC